MNDRGSMASWFSCCAQDDSVVYTESQQHVSVHTALTEDKQETPQETMIKEALSWPSGLDAEN